MSNLYFSSKLRRAITEQAIGRIVATLFSFGAVALTTRYLGPASYGLLTSSLAFVGLFAAFSDLGVNTVIARMAAQDSNKSINHLVRVSLGISVAVSIATVILVLTIGWLTFGSSNLTSFTIVSALVPYLIFSSFASALTPLFQAANDFKGVSAGDAISAFITLLGAALISSYHGPILAFIMVTNLAALVRLAVISSQKYARSTLMPSFDFATLRSLVTEALPIAGTTIIGVVYYRLDTVLLSVLSSDSEVGLYALSYRGIALVMIIPQLATTGAFFSLAASNSDSGQLESQMRTLVRTTISLTAPLILGGILLSGEIMNFIGGESFSKGGPAFAILLMANGLIALNSCLGIALTATHRQRALIVFGLTSLLINVLALVILAPAYGATGASIALLMPEILASIALVAFMRNVYSPFFLLVDSWRILLALLAMVALVLFIQTLKIHFLFSVFGGGVAYVAALVLFGLLKPSGRGIRTGRK